MINEIIRPRGRLPVSPRMIFAGGKLKIKKPKTINKEMFVTNALELMEKNKTLKSTGVETRSFLNI